MSKVGNDKRMEWIIELSKVENSENQCIYKTYYEICSEVYIPGCLEYKNFFKCHPYIIKKNERGLYTYILEINYVREDFSFNENDYSNDGYYFSGGIIGELLAIFSFYFKARFYLSAKISGGNDTIEMKTEYIFRNSSGYISVNKEMFSNEGRNWASNDGLRLFLDQLILLDQKYHQNLIRSFDWYAEAIKDLCFDHQLFFIKMVSSVEALINFEPIVQDDLNKKLSSLINKNEFVDNECSEIENWLKNRGIRKKFYYFYISYSKGFFKGGKRKASHCYIKSSELSNYIKRIYDARSKYLHEGVPMYLSDDFDMSHATCWDLDPSLGKMCDRRKINVKNKLPRVRWFERITNHCVRNFIKNRLNDNF